MGGVSRIVESSLNATNFLGDAMADIREEKMVLWDPYVRNLLAAAGICTHALR